MRLFKLAVLTALFITLAGVLRGELPLNHCHVLTENTCTSPAVCTLCMHTIYPAKPHTIIDATCEESAYCVDCGTVFSPPRGHIYKARTCLEPKKCVVCGKYSGVPKNHTVVDSTCTTASYCSECMTVFAPPLGHDITAATCTQKSTCSRCGEVFGKALGHDVKKATCTKPITCLRCGKTFGKKLGHDVVSATCTKGGYCRRCGKAFSPALGHKIVPATCVSSKHCSRCGTVFAPAIGHKWTSSVLCYPTCVGNGSKLFQCSTCGEKYYEAIPAVGHSYLYDKSSATCSVCGYHRIQLNVGMLYQGRAYPNGCESVSAVMALRYMGIDISVDTFIEYYLSKASLPHNGVGANPRYSFIGDPRLSSGYYCFAPAIGNAVNSLIDKNKYYCTVHEGVSLESLCRNYIDCGIPFVIWSTLGMSPLSYTSHSWQISGTGETHYLIRNLHCVLLTGYDDTYYYINDPLSGQVVYLKSTVNASFLSLGSQAVTISKGG